MSEYNMPDKGLFGRRCLIPTGYEKRPFVYRIVHSGTISNYWSEVPLTYRTETNPVNHRERMEEVLIVVVDTLISENSRLIRVARKDVELMNEAKCPTMWGDGYADGELVLESYECPVCGAVYDFDTDGKHNFCPNCGQKLEWEEE